MKDKRGLDSMIHIGNLKHVRPTGARIVAGSYCWLLVDDIQSSFETLFQLNQHPNTISIAAIM
jgi:hypothetical protein